MASSLHKIAVHENKNYVKSGIKSYAWLLNKYSLTPPRHSPFYRAELDETTKKTPVRSIAYQRFLHPAQKPVGRLMKKLAAGGGGRHTTTEDIQNDTKYLTEVQFNGQNQPFQLDFDTGSSDLWILSQQLTQNFPDASNHSLFDTSSTGFTPIPDASFEIHYGDNSYAKGSPGNVGTADLLIGGLTVKNQAVEAANDVDQSFISGAGDGLLGLAWGSINTVVPNQVQTPVENMITQEDIPQNQELFTAKLGSWRDAADPDHGDSFYTFGFIDQPTLDAAGGPIWYTPLVHNNSDGFDGFWRFSSTSIVVNGQSFARNGNTAIADTGTTLALIDDAALENIYKPIPGATISQDQGGWIYPASTSMEQLPTISVDVGGKQFGIQKEDIGFNGFTDQNGEEWIFGSFQSRGQGQDFDILGDAFLKSIYAIFDQGFVQGDGTKGRFGAVQRSELVQNISVPPSLQ